MTLPSQTALEMAEAAAAWLGSLNDEQRATAHGVVPAHDGNADAERRRWFYTPTDHGGLTMHQQAPAQQRAAMKLVATGLSLAGYVTVATTMGLENVLDRMEEFVAALTANGAGTRGCTTCASLACQVAMSRGAGASAATTSR